MRGHKSKGNPAAFQYEGTVTLGLYALSGIRDSPQALCLREEFLAEPYVPRSNLDEFVLGHEVD